MGALLLSVCQAMTTLACSMVSDCRLMHRPAVLGRLVAPGVQAVVAHDRGNAQPIVAEDAGASRRLGCAMRCVMAPGRNRGLVAPERQRQELVGIGEALKSLHRDEPVHA